MLSFLYVYSDHSILECYNLFSGVELSMRSFFVILVKHQWFLERNFAGENSTFVALHRVCRKARKSVFAMFIWRLSSIFDPGLCVFDGPVRIQHFTPCARVVDRQALGTRLDALLMVFSWAQANSVVFSI